MGLEFRRVLFRSLEYRGYNGKIKSQYSYLNKDKEEENVFFWENSQNWFFIPQNVFVIGTMNNIDRSVDSFDFALRRRFIWKEVEPNYGIITSILTEHGIAEEIVTKLKDSLVAINSEIQNDPLLGKDYRIGHSYVLELKKTRSDRFETIREVRVFLWNDFIMPLLEEYLRGLGDDKKATDKLNSFKQIFGLKEDESE